MDLMGTRAAEAALATAKNHFYKLFLRGRVYLLATKKPFQNRSGKANVLALGAVADFGAFQCQHTTTFNAR